MVNNMEVPVGVVMSRARHSPRSKAGMWSTGNSRNIGTAGTCSNEAQLAIYNFVG
jgi:hypothetical protein